MLEKQPEAPKKEVMPEKTFQTNEQSALVKYLGQKGEPTTFEWRAELAKAVGMEYTGAHEQDTELLALLIAIEPKPTTPSQPAMEDSSKKIENIETLPGADVTENSGHTETLPQKTILDRTHKKSGVIHRDSGCWTTPAHLALDAETED